MKLVDILARELKVWPNDQYESIGQADDGALHKSPNWDTGCGWSKEKYTMAEDWSRVHVTRAQWQAAVDALKASENAVPEWNGEGLPPVGAVCEYRDSLGAWEKVEITAIARNGICFVQDSHGGENYAPKDPAAFRPIRTPEQIAAEELDRLTTLAIEDITPISGYAIKSCCCVQASQTVIRAMLHKGYRKFEIVDN